MPIFVVTTNEQKYKDYISGLHMYDVHKYTTHINEIQSMDLATIVKDKMYQCKIHGFLDPTIVDDVSLELDDLHGFPGPFIKFMVTSMGLQHMSKKFHGGYADFHVATAFAENDTKISSVFINSLKCQIIDTPDAYGTDFEQILYIPNLHRRFTDLTVKERSEIHPRFQNVREIINKLNKQ